MQIKHQKLWWLLAAIWLVAGGKVGADLSVSPVPGRWIGMMYSDGWQSASFQIVLYAVLVVCSGLGLWFFYRHQEAVRRLTTEQESALRNRDEQLRSLGDNLPDSALCQYSLDQGGNLSFMYMSAGIAKITGVLAEDILRNPQRLRDQFLPEDWDKLVSQQTLCSQTLADLDVTLPMFRTDGEVRWMHFHARARHLPGGQVVWDGVQTDVTARKQAEDELVKYKNHLQVMVNDNTESLIAKERFIHSLVDNLPGMVSYWDKNLRCQFANRAYLDWFGLMPGKMLGNYLPDLFGDEFYAANRVAIQAVLHGEPQLFERKLTKPNGETGYLLAHYLPDVVDGEVAGYITLVSDVTMLKESEKALIKAKQAAEAANIAKSRFLGTMGHELRTPLNAILGMAQLLQFSGLEESDRQEYAGTVVSSGRSLLTLLNDILDLSRLEEGAVTLAQTELMPDFLLSEVLNLYEASAISKGLRMEAEWLGDVPLCFGDRSRLRQMLSNLTSNALKFTEEGEVKLYGREVARDDGKVVLEFSVSDTGIGIAPEQQAKLFLPFTQLDDAANRKFEGAGLGLSIVKELAHLMGGEVGVESIPGEGARFWLQLPFSLAHDVALLDMEASLA